MKVVRNGVGLLWVAVIALSAVIAGCGGGGGDKSDVTATENAGFTGEGKVYAQVVDRSTRSAVKDAKVTLYLDNINKTEVTTDENGQFSISNVPSGELFREKEL